MVNKIAGFSQYGQFVKSLMYYIEVVAEDSEYESEVVRSLVRESGGESHQGEALEPMRNLLLRLGL